MKAMIGLAFLGLLTIGGQANACTSEYCRFIPSAPVAPAVEVDTACSGGLGCELQPPYDPSIEVDTACSTDYCRFIPSAPVASSIKVDIV